MPATTIRVKLYSILRIKYGGSNYNAEEGLTVSFNHDVTVCEICEKLDINQNEVASFVLDNKMQNNKSIKIKDGDVVGLHFHLPQGG